MTTSQFETLLYNYGNDIYGFCCHLTGSRQSADDLYQDSVLKAFEILGRIDGRTDNGFKSARNYIIGIAVKLYKNQRRKKSSGECFMEDGFANSLRDPSDIVEDTELRTQYAEVRRAVSELPEKLRIVVYMYYYAEMSISDISSQLGIPEGTVKSRMNNARKKLKNILDKPEVNRHEKKQQIRQTDKKRSEYKSAGRFEY
ncbi:MAG: RNA polymerase sigma factor [Ruminococcus sp.]|nr:RNA polymerase sigma factor [Ruminococcus sp.]MDE7225259.1 RNA polymerase sigma factor [Ruminococcus sp.]